LLVITDDQGYGDFGLHGNTVVETPVFDRFASEGQRFERFYVSPVCAPTRASLLTGRWWLRTGCWGVTHSKENMRPEEVTVAEALRAGGYATGCFGKWHNGEQFPYTPPGQGFDEFLGFNNGHWNNYFDARLIRGSQFVQTEGYIVDVLTDAAIEFIEQNRRKPFFCYVSYNTPHSPFQLPDRYFDKYRARGLDDVLASVYGMCENIDDNFGRLLDALDRLGLRRDTIVLFLTDNGANTDRFNAGMRGRKASVHEGGIRVPLAVQWPAGLPHARVVEELAAHIDLYPTLLELCGVEAPPGPPIDGVSLVPLLQGRAEGWPDRLLFTHNRRGNDVEPQPVRGSVRNRRYRAVLERPDAWQLYDMIADPGQERNIAAEQPAVVGRLAAAYRQWFEDVTRDGFARPPIPVGYAEHDPVEFYAPQAEFTGEIRFFAGQGYSNDWLTGWTRPEDRIEFPLDVVRGGVFAVELIYACQAADAGSTVRVRCGERAIEAAVPAAPAPRIPLPHRDAGRDTYIDRQWGTLAVGDLPLAAGRQSLVIEAVRTAGGEVLELKHVLLRRVE
jgi:arylsulfatase A